MDRKWNRVGEGTPLNAWLETRREGEEGENLCHCRIVSIGDEPEWCAKNGRTTVTHHSFAAPTHWRWPETPFDGDPNARLNIAAPTMLAVLKAIRERCDGRLGPGRAAAVNQIADMCDVALALAGAEPKPPR